MIIERYAPIVLFVYNRPEHTLRTLEALARNDLAEDSTLYIYADGPKEGESMELNQPISDTREYARRTQWCKNVIIVEKESNDGLANSIINGVSEVVNRHGKVIVLEDDIVTSPGFLQYMNDALDMYADKEKVWHVSGYWYPVKGSNNLPKTFFFNAATCWGWGTWKEAWSNLITDPVELKKKVLEREDGLYHFNIEGGYSFFDQLQMNIDNVLNTWAVKWYGTIFINRAFSLHPNHSLTNNIGFDGSGINCEVSSVFTWKKLAERIKIEKNDLVESQQSRFLFSHFFNPKPRLNLFSKIIRQLKLLYRMVAKFQA